MIKKEKIMDYEVLTPCCTKCDKKAYVEYKDKKYCTWYCAKKKGQNMIFDFAMVGLTWMGIIGFICFAAYVCSDGPDYNSKAYRDLDETMKNRNEVI